MVKHLQVTVLHKIFFAQNYEIVTSILQTGNYSAESKQPIMSTVCHNHHLFLHPEKSESYPYMCDWLFLNFYIYIHLLPYYSASICWQTRQAVNLKGGRIKVSSASCPFNPGTHRIWLLPGVYTLVNSSSLSPVPHPGSNFSLPVSSSVVSFMCIEK